MPGNVRPVTDERDALLTYLAQERYVLRLTAYGLTDAQAAQATSAGSLTVGGLVRHVASVERFWMSLVAQRPSPGSDEPDDGAQEYKDTFAFGPDDALAAVLDDYERAAEETEALLATIDDLGRPVPVPWDVPWFPDDVEAWSVRWVLLHLITETARHAGHADIVREGIDGASAFPLMAAAEGWPATPWMEPWKPAVTT